MLVTNSPTPNMNSSMSLHDANSWPESTQLHPTNSPTTSEYELLSYCIQASNTRGDSHEITTVISKAGKVISTECSCTAGKGQKCKHNVGVLIFCSR